MLDFKNRVSWIRPPTYPGYYFYVSQGKVRK